MLSHHSFNAVVPLCTAFPIVQAHHSYSIATVNMTKNTKANREALWQQQGLTRGKRAPNELMLRQSLRRIFPDEEIVFKARKAMKIKREDGEGLYLEVDASIPRLKFHIEYQDPYHYTGSLHYSNRPLAAIQDLDAFKKKHLTERGESLLQLPCWWDGTDESLVATIKVMRPDLLPHQNPSCPPVPETEPHNFLQHDFIPDAGPLMRPVFFSKTYYKQGGDWLGNEKLDGIRCCWNPKKRKLYSRRANELRFPENYEQRMPDAFLDGEVWFGRGQFNEAAKLNILRTSAIDWPSFRISAFDIAGTDSTQMTYDERYNKLHSVISNDHPFLFIPSIIQINSEEQRLNFEKLIANNGGEGMILTQRNSLYEHGYTSKVLKAKPSLDKEALVVASDSEHLTLQLTDGTRFRTLIPNIQPPPRVRDVITFTYNRCVQGSTLPEKPQIHRVRGDVTWSEVVASANEGVPLSNVGRDYSTRWDRNLDDLKGYFTKFAQENNFDPLVPANWYDVQRQEIMALPGAYNMLKGFNGSIIHALIASFPDIGLDKSMFSRVPKGHWKNIHNVRKWFDRFAKLKGFDPLIAHNWSRITYADILDQKSGRGIIFNFKNSHINALIAAYPDIGLDKSMFSHVPQGHWKNIQNVRKWFDKFAKQKVFDPLIAQNWYSITQADILNQKGGYILTQYFKDRNYINALIASYPEIELDKSMFTRVPQGYWKNTQNVRNWFDEFAKLKGFDPLVARNWYAVTRADISDQKGGQSLIQQCKNSHINALITAYPEIGLDKSMFSTVPLGHWKNIQNVRKWFDKFAKKNGFDPLIAQNWYSITQADILDQKGANGIIYHFNYSLINTLIAAYPEIGLDKSKFSTVPHGHWQDIRNVRKWFLAFAKEKGFDPLIADNWAKNITTKDIKSVKGGSRILDIYVNLANALEAAFSELKFPN